MKIRSRSEKIFIYVNLIVLIFICLTILIPLINTLAVSFSSAAYVTAGEVFLLPKGATLDNYGAMFSSSGFWYSFATSVIVTIVGTAIALTCTTLAAYALSNRNLWQHRRLMVALIFTMMFSGGMIPSYIVVNALGIMNTLWALILPGCVGAYNIILVKNYMEGLPESVYESAAMEGATPMQVFRYITLPLSKPVIATVGLFSAVGYWNGYMGGVLYISDPNKLPLQTKLHNYLATLDMRKEMTPQQLEMFADVSNASMQSVVIVVSTVPILVVYPFLQKHFVKGIVVGTDK